MSETTPERLALPCLRYIGGERLIRGRVTLVVIDTTNDRAELICADADDLARNVALMNRLDQGGWL